MNVDKKLQFLFIIILIWIKKVSLSRILLVYLIIIYLIIIIYYLFIN